MTPHRSHAVVLGLVLASVACRDSGGSEASSSESTGATTDPTTSTSTETETGTQDCDLGAALACYNQVDEAHEACKDGCEAPDTCAGVACRWACLGEREFGRIDCAQQWCPAHDYPERACEAACHTATGECAEQPDCEPNDCDFAAMVCLAENCHPCQEIELVYEYEGSCTIELPGVVPESKRNWTEVEISEPPIDASVIEGECDEPGAGAIWAPAFDAFTLCPEACEAFAMAPSMSLSFLSPPCE